MVKGEEGEEGAGLGLGLGLKDAVMVMVVMMVMMRYAIGRMQSRVMSRLGSWEVL